MTKSTALKLSLLCVFAVLAATFMTTAREAEPNKNPAYSAFAALRLIWPQS
jgi:hypothetical protein